MERVDAIPKVCPRRGPGRSVSVIRGSRGSQQYRFRKSGATSSENGEAVVRGGSQIAHKEWGKRDEVGEVPEGRKTSFFALRETKARGRG